jgi:Mg-chelatase subunit ChlD
MDALPAAVDQLAACRAPALIGVRHHSAALARAMPVLLDRLKPRRLLVELPSDLDPWLPWLADPATTAPVALSAVAPDGSGLCFLPFADFSPELAALRWAQAHNVPAHGIDLPTDRRRAFAGRQASDGGIHDCLHRSAGVDDAVTWWDRLIEVPACGRDPEELRRAALAVGRAWRDDAPASEHDLAREAWMRQRIAELGADGAVAVVGSFHAAALVGAIPACAIPEAGEPSRTALIPYTFAQFDERSGYGAGIRDPAWQQTAWAAADAAALDAALAAAAVAVCRRMRGQRHQASTADARELVRVARDLARLRGLPAAGRGELVEAAQCVLARGELLGAGRAVAAALEHELVGERRGRLPPACPRSGLEPAVERLLADLNLPGPEQLGEAPRELRLDPLRSDLDRLRAVLLARLDQLGVSYGRRDDADDAEHLGQAWTLQWTAASAATLAAAAVHGAETAQAATGELAGRTRRVGDDPDQVVALAGLAARGGLGHALDGLLARLVAAPFLDSARLPGLVAAMALLTRLQRGHEPGLPATSVVRPGMALAAWRVPDGVDAAPLVLAAERCLDGLAGSDRVEDVIALLDLWAWWSSAAEGEAPGDGRLRYALRRMHASGGALMQGAAAGLLARLGDITPDALGCDLGGWIDAALDGEGRARLRARFSGLLLTADSLLAAAPEALDQAHNRLAASPDDVFLARLPALRTGALALGPAARQRLLEALLVRHAAGERSGCLADDPLRLAAWGAADAAAAAVMDRLLGPVASAYDAGVAAGAAATPCGGSISAADRWRLVLGEPRAAPAQVMRAARVLEACYGRGSGEGSARGMGQGGGDGSPDPDVRTWDEEVTALFGGDVREEVLADRAMTTPAALELLDPARAVPSVALLERVLSLHGGLPAGAAPQLRRLARRLVDALAAALAQKLRPSLSGLGVARTTRRHSPRLDLRATVRANLDQVRHGPDGPQLVLRRLRFLARARRQMDWHLVLVVDVSSSMEASMVHSALMASVFAGLPALSVGFVAVSTEVVDLSGRVEDPLGLLLEVRVGGGTRLGLGLHRARGLLRVPSRSMVVLISDFEEGVSTSELLGEVRALRDAGARLLGMAALDAHGQPRYHAGIAAQVAAAGMPVAALSPQHVARWVAEQLR